MVLIWTHTHFCNSHRRERERYLQGEGALVWGFVFVLLIIYIEEVFVGFSSPRGFPRINRCLSCYCVSSSDLVYAIFVKLN